MNLSWSEQVIETLIAQANPMDAPAMEAYMRNQFRFLGVKKNERVAQTKFLMAKVLRPVTLQEVMQEVTTLWQQPEREFQYVAMELLAKSRSLYTAKSVAFLEHLIIEKSWWDTVDNLAANEVGFLIHKFPEVKADLQSWITDPYMWKRRTAIIAQLMLKIHTDTAFLEQAILANLGTKEFFINKAIGWSLRQYARTNAQWVLQFLDRHESKMAPLSVREAVKHINKLM